MFIIDKSASDITTEHIKHSGEVTSEIPTTTTKHKDAVIEHIVYFAPPIEKSIMPPSPITVKYTTSSEPTSTKPIVTSIIKPVTSSAPTTIKLVETLAQTTEKIAISSTFSPKLIEITSPVSKPLEDEDYSFESMFSFLFSGDTPEKSVSSSSISSIDNIHASETHIEHRTNDEIDEKIHLDDVKPQTDFISFADLFGTNENSDMEQTANPMNLPNTKSYSNNKKQHSEEKHNKMDPQDSKNPIEPKPSSETKQKFDIKSNFKINQKTDTKILPEVKQNTDTKILPEIKQNTDTKLLPEIIQNTDSKLLSETKQNTDTKLFPDNKQNIDTKLHPEIKQNLDAKPHVEVDSSINIKQQTEVKTHFDVKESTQITSQLDFKHRDELETHQNLDKHQTEVKSHFDVREHSEVNTNSDSKPQSEDKVYSDFPHHTEMKMPFDVNKKVEDVKPYFDFKHQIEVKPHADLEYRIDGTSEPEIKAQPDVKANVKPLKTKIDANFNLVASILKISGCNIYGRMYRVGKIISELSNPCLECMCTEIGVHCNQLKC